MGMAIPQHADSASGSPARRVIGYLIVVKSSLCHYDYVAHVPPIPIAFWMHSSSLDMPGDDRNSAPCKYAMICTVLVRFYCMPIQEARMNPSPMITCNKAVHS